MLDLISLIVTLIIMSLFGLGILMETIQNNEDEIDFIKKWQEEQKEKKEARRKIFHNFKMKIKKFFTRR